MGGVFLVTLLIVSIITVRISDLVLDSRIGALDRTLGFLFGLARGFLIMVVAFLFFNWLVQNEQGQPDWIRDARSKVVLQSAGDWLISVLPEDPETLIRDIRELAGYGPGADGAAARAVQSGTGAGCARPAKPAPIVRPRPWDKGIPGRSCISA